MTRTVRGIQSLERMDWCAGRDRGMRSRSLGLLALGTLTFLLVAAGGAPGGVSVRGAAMLRAAGSPGAPTPRNLTFYMHNATIGKDVNGITTPYIFDTWQAFGQNNTVSKIQEVRQDWYLFPVLAGSLSLNGTITMHVFASIDLVGAQITPTLTVDELNRTGVKIPVYSNT